MEEKYEKSADSIRAQILEDRGVEEKEEARGGGGHAVLLERTLS